MTEQNPQPDPPRFRWLKRLAWTGVIALVAVAGLRAWWGHVAGARLQAMVEVIEGRGDPLHIEQISPDPVDEENNAATYLREALNAWPKVNGEYVSAYFELYGGEDPVKDSRKYLDDCRDAIALVERAIQCDQCDWQVATNRPLLPLPLDRFQTTRPLARVLEDAAKREHRTGDDTAAVKIIGHQVAIARLDGAPPAFLIHHLVAISDIARATANLEKLAPKLGAKAGLSSNTADPELRGAVKVLIDDLLDDKPMTTSLHNAWQGERVFMYDVGSTIVTGDISVQTLGVWPPVGPPGSLEKTLVFAFRPHLEIDHARALRNFEDVVPAVTSTDTYPGFRAAAPELDSEPELSFDSTPDYFHPLSGPGMGTSYLGVASHYLGRAKARMAATALAIRLYQLDHGRRPETLDQLVPAYLPAVPIDPFAADGRSIAYKPDGVRPKPSWPVRSPEQMQALFGDHRFAVLYSVGRDGEDDGGLLKAREDRELYWHPDDDENADIGFILDEQPPRIPTAKGVLDYDSLNEEEDEDSLEETPDGDGEVTDDDRDDDENQPGQ